MSADQSPGPSMSKKVVFDRDGSDTDYDIADLWVDAVSVLNLHPIFLVER